RKFDSVKKSGIIHTVMLKEKIQNALFQFEGWEFALSPGQFNLISILKFRRTKDDFTYDKCAEHTEISKFVSYVAETTTDENWKKVASALSEDGCSKHCQASYGGSLRHRLMLRTLFVRSPNDFPAPDVSFFVSKTHNHFISQAPSTARDVKLFWIITQFAVDRYVSGNEAYMIADKAKLTHMSALDVITTPPPDTFLTTLPPPDTSLTTPPSDTPRTPEHQIYRKQDDYSESFGFLSSDISDDLDDLILLFKSNGHDNDDEFGVKDKDLFKQRFEAWTTRENGN
ncbi:385_t:CDS:2, partial [Funneliformis mosseae]